MSRRRKKIFKRSADPLGLDKPPEFQLKQSVLGDMSSILKQMYSQQNIQQLAYQQSALMGLVAEPVCTDQSHHPKDMVIPRRVCTHIDCIVAHVMES